MADGPRYEPLFPSWFVSVLTRAVSFVLAFAVTYVAIGVEWLSANPSYSGGERLWLGAAFLNGVLAAVYGKRFWRICRDWLFP